MIINTLKGLFFYKPCVNKNSLARRLLCLKKHFNYKYEKHSSIEIVTLYPTLGSYVRYMEEVNEIIKTNGNINTINNRESKSNVLLNKWITTEEGYIIDDIDSVIDRFITLSIEINDYHELYKHNYDKPDKQIYSYRLQYVIKNIDEITKTLIEE